MKRSEIRDSGSLTSAPDFAALHPGYRRYAAAEDIIILPPPPVRSTAKQREDEEMPKTSFDAEYDVVVIGAGSAGCVLSARLTENPKVSLCVIEAGKRDRNPWIHVPMGFGKLVPNPNVNWGYETEPEPGLDGRKIVWPRGKVLGGSGSINGLVFLRGPSSDYDDWEALGA